MYYDIDVLVKFYYVGFDIIWFVECKYWKNLVLKFYVLVLCEIVIEIGVDWGILLFELGF